MTTQVKISKRLALLWLNNYACYITTLNGLFITCDSDGGGIKEVNGFRYIEAKDTTTLKLKKVALSDVISIELVNGCGAGVVYDINGVLQ